MNDPFSVFIKEMISSKQWNSNLDDEAREQLEIDLRSKLMDQIDQAVVEALPEDKVDELGLMLDDGVSDDEVRDFISNSGVDTQRITTEIMLRFRDLYIEDQSTKG